MIGTDCGGIYKSYFYAIMNKKTLHDNMILIHLNVSIVEVQQGDMKVPITKPDINKANPKIGVGLVAFSCDCKYMYTKNGLYTVNYIS